MKNNDLKVNSGEVDKKVVEQKEAQFDAINSAVANKKYELKLDSDAVAGLFEFFDFVDWKGYECYGIEKLYDSFIPHLTECGEAGEESFTLETEVEADVIEAMFYFIKSYTSSGIDSARLFRKMADGFAIPMQNINIDRQALRDAALELQAAEQGLTVEQLQEAVENAQN